MDGAETPWLTDLQHQLGFSAELDFRRFSDTHLNDARLFCDLNALYAILVDEQQDVLRKQSAAVEFFSDLQLRLNPIEQPMREPNFKLERAADFIRRTAPTCSASTTSARRPNCHRRTSSARSNSITA